MNDARDGSTESPLVTAKYVGQLVGTAGLPAAQLARFLLFFDENEDRVLRLFRRLVEVYDSPPPDEVKGLVEVLLAGESSSGANTSGQDVESGDSGDTVTLKFQDAAGVQQEITAELRRGRLSKDQLVDLLSGSKVSLVTMNGAAPIYDPDGYTTKRFRPGDVVELTTVIRPEDEARDAAARESLLTRLWAKINTKVGIFVTILVCLIGAVAVLGAATINSKNKPAPPPLPPPFSTHGTSTFNSGASAMGNKTSIGNKSIKQVHKP